jgi:hypothetical protein
VIVSIEKEERLLQPDPLPIPDPQYPPREEIDEFTISIALTNEVAFMAPPLPIPAPEEPPVATATQS